MGTPRRPYLELCHLTYAQILSWSETTKGKDHLETLEILS
jgi:hypothetical protein